MSKAQCHDKVVAQESDEQVFAVGNGNYQMEISKMEISG